MTTTDLYDQIYKLEAEKRAEEQAEAERIAREQEHRRKIAEREAEIQRLRLQARDSAFEDAVTVHRQLQGANDAAQTPLIDALDQIGMELAGVLKNELAAVMRTFEAQMNYRQQALAEYENATPVDPNNPIDVLRLMGPQEHRLQQDTGLPPWAVLAHWIANSPDEPTRQIRRGLAFALTGQQGNPTPGYDPRQDLNQAAKIYRRMY